MAGKQVDQWQIKKTEAPGGQKFPKVKELIENTPGTTTQISQPPVY